VQRSSMFDLAVSHLAIHLIEQATKTQEEIDYASTSQAS